MNSLNSSAFCFGVISLRPWPKSLLGEPMDVNEEGTAFN